MASRPKHFTDSRTTNFYYAFLFLPAEKRQAIEAVYHFARRSDDAADSQRDPEAGAREVERYRELLDRCYAAEAESLHDPALEALHAAIRRFKIPRQPFEDLLLGLEMDLQMDTGAIQYRTFEELEVYCYRVASTIGLITIEIFGYRNSQTREYAVQLGKALQMVNILRDIQTDARRGRVYLPTEDLKRFEVDPQRLAEGCYNEAFVRLMEFEARRARDLFDRARRARPSEDRRSLLPAEVMAAIYWRLMRKIEKRAYNVFGEPVRISRPAKLLIASSVYLGLDGFR
jgi:15-cis-phytoene synthase